MKFLQKLGKSIMLPIACLPLCGILMGIGYLLCPAAMQGGEISGTVPLIGQFLLKAGGALIDHIALLFALGIGVGLSDDQNGASGVSALVSWLIITSLLQADFVTSLVPSVAENPTALLAFQKIENPFIGILAGIIGSTCYNRFKNTDLPEWLAFFSRKRSAVIISGLVSVAVSALLFFIWPVLFGGLVRLGKGIAGLGYIGASLYAFLNRLLVPLGLHHALNNVFWFDTIGLGDLTHFWAGHTSADVTWSLGVYMSGFFPCMMFGIPGATLAIVHCAKDQHKKYVVGILASAAICSFVCGITEPFEFAFMFCAPVLYVVYALLYGIFTYITAVVGFRAGFSFSAGATDLIFSASLPAASRTWLILPLGAAAFMVFYLVFRFMICIFHLQTPGNEADESDTAGLPVNQQMPKKTAAVETTTATISPMATAPLKSSELQPDRQLTAGIDTAAIISGLGGRENIVTLDNCATRLRAELKDDSLVDEYTLKKSGAKAVMRTGKNSVQVIIGLKVQKVMDIIREQL